MVITCPSCKRRFNLPLDKVRSRTAKLKCSRCKSLFTQDLAALADVREAKATPGELELLARLPAAAPPPPARPAPKVQPAARTPVTRPMAPVAPKPAPQPAARTSQTRRLAPVAPRPAPQPQPVVPVIAGYESYAEAPAVGEEHQEALARAAEAALEHAELQAKEEEEARAAAEALRQAQGRLAEEEEAQAAVGAALEQAAEEAIDSTGPLPEPPSAEEAFGPSATDTLPPDLVAGLDAVAAGELAADEEPAAEEPLITTGPRREDAADLFRGAQTPSGRFAIAGAAAGAELDDFLLLSDEETPGPGRWIALGLGILLALFVAASLFVLARNSWKLDTGHLGRQIRYAFWMGPPVVDTASCVVTTMRLPAVVKGQDGFAVVVWGLTENICPYSVSGVSFSCTLDGPGGQWKDSARPFLERAPSDLSEPALAEETVSGMAQAIADRENSVGVVLANQKHEVWCIFSGAAGVDSRATQFRSSLQVTTP